MNLIAKVYLSFVVFLQQMLLSISKKTLNLYGFLTDVAFRTRIFISQNKQKNG